MRARRSVDGCRRVAVMSARCILLLPRRGRREECILEVRARHRREEAALFAADLCA
jgi:protein subunit release factor A